jgi:pyridoxamine 5'-phosphate oxidase
VSDDSATPEHLRLLRISLHLVEQLDLKPHPHLRRLWTSSRQWQEQRINP